MTQTLLARPQTSSSLPNRLVEFGRQTRPAKSRQGEHVFTGLVASRNEVVQFFRVGRRAPAVRIVESLTTALASPGAFSQGSFSMLADLRLLPTHPPLLETRLPVPYQGGTWNFSLRSNVQPPEVLAFAHQASGPGIFLLFADGRTGTVMFRDLGIATDGLKLDTIRADTSGTAVEVEDAAKHTVHIDSAVLRAYIDPQYAKVLVQIIAEG